MCSMLTTNSFHHLDTTTTNNHLNHSTKPQISSSRNAYHPGLTSSLSSDLPNCPPPSKCLRVLNKQKVEAEYAWSCPMTNCGRVHMSVKVDGVWGPEKERESVGKTMGPGKPEARGAIPIFA